MAHAEDEYECLAIDRINLRLYSWYADGVQVGCLSKAARGLQDYGVTIKKSRENYLQLRVPLGQKRSTLTLVFTPFAERVNLLMDVDFNATRSLARILASPKDKPALEQSLDGSSNLLHFDDIEVAGWKLLAVVTHLQVERYVRETIIHVQDLLAATMEVPLSFYGPEVTVSKAELYRDFEVTDSLKFVYSIKPQVLQSFRSCEAAHYPLHRRTESLQRDSLCITADIARHEKHKVYSKTDRRVRFEATLDSKQIQRKRGTARFDPSKLGSLLVLLGFVAPRLHDSMAEFFPSSHVETREISEAEFVLHFFQALRNSEEVHYALDRLPRNGRLVAASENYNLVQRLVRRKVVQRCSRGVYRLCADKRKVLNALRSVVLKVD